MSLRDPREVERQIDELRAAQKAVLDDTTIPEQDRRDRFMSMSGEIQALEVQARELRDFEVEQLRNLAAGAKIGGVTSTADAERSAAFRDMLRTDVKNAALLTTPDANGGYLMPNPERAAMLDVVRKINPIMADATVFELTKPGTFKVQLPRKTAAGDGGWVGETAARPATNAPTFARPDLECFEWYAMPEATQSSLDAIDGAEQMVLDDIADTFAEVTATAFAVGTGVTQPSGAFKATGVYTTKLSAAAGALDAAQIISSYFALPAKFLPGAKFYANGATFAALSALAWPNMNNTALVKWDNNTPTILGKACTICDDAPAIGAANFPLMFGDLKSGYAVGVHTQITTLRDPFTNKPYVRFYTTGRVGGVPWHPSAVLLLKSNNA